MRSTKSIILVVIAVGCGLVASIGISQVMESRAGNDTGVESEKIYVALTNIPIGAQLTPQMLKLEDWPKDKVPLGAIRSVEEVEGKSPVFPLYSGEPIVREKLVDGKGGVAGRIPTGMRAVAVKVNEESSASGLILPGDRVDVLVFLRGGGGFGRDNIKTGTRTILRDVTVFAVNEQITRQMEEGETAMPAKTVSLLVKPSQAEKLILAKQLGQIHLSLRQPGDDADDETDGASFEDLDNSDRGAQWPGQVAEKSGSELGSGIIGLLDKMKTGEPDSSDTSSDGMRIREMVILSPQGIDGRYTWVGDTVGLPRELLDTFQGVGASVDAAETGPRALQADSESALDSNDDDPRGEGITDKEDDALNLNLGL